MAKKIKVASPKEAPVIPAANPVYVKFMHMGKGRLVVKKFNTIDEAKAYGKTLKPWMSPSGKIEYPELAVEPGLLEIVS